MRHRTPQFGHVFAGDGYSAGYYSYLWSDTLTADAFEAFTEGKGAYDQDVAERLRKNVFSVGNTVDPAEAYRAFRGRDAGIDALMRKRGFPVPGAPATREGEVGTLRVLESALLGSLQHLKQPASVGVNAGEDGHVSPFGIFEPTVEMPTSTFLLLFLTQAPPLSPPCICEAAAPSGSVFSSDLKRESFRLQVNEATHTIGAKMTGSVDG